MKPHTRVIGLAVVLLAGPLTARAQEEGVDEREAVEQEKQAQAD